ncbi:hypothetical protein ACU686_34065 [Yinghuangia aomiensis]
MLAERGGPARCSDQLAVGMGFADMSDLLDRSRRLRAALRDDVPLAPADWARTLLAAEIVLRQRPRRFQASTGPRPPASTDEARRSAPCARSSGSWRKWSGVTTASTPGE